MKLLTRSSVSSHSARFNKHVRSGISTSYLEELILAQLLHAMVVRSHNLPFRQILISGCV